MRGLEITCFQSEEYRDVSASRVWLVCITAQDVSEVLLMLLLGQEDTSTLGGQGTHFKYYGGNEGTIGPRQQRNLGLVPLNRRESSGRIKDSSPQKLLQGFQR